MSADAPEQDLLAAIESGQAPRRILEFAARGFVPLAPADLVRAVASILTSADPELAPLCEETFRGFDVESLHGAVRSEGIRTEQLDAIADETGVDGILFSFPDFVQGIRDFGEKVAPHLTTARPRGGGLRGL